MKSRSIKVDYLARVEGEGALHVKIRGKKVTDVKLRIFEPPRFFEAFLRGRHFMEAPDITARHTRGPRIPLRITSWSPWCHPVRTL